MTWDGNAYGSHAETSLAAPATTWYLAEGSTSGAFALFYLLQNPGATPADVTVRYLRPFGAPPTERTYTLAADSRMTIPVDDVGTGTGVDGRVSRGGEHAADHRRAGDVLNVPGQPFAAGHESAGVTAPATRWFLAEGATGPYSISSSCSSNPSTSAANVTSTICCRRERHCAKTTAVPAKSRSTIWVDDERPGRRTARWPTSPSRPP